MINSVQYDAILMDINLGKGMSGAELTKIIREMEIYKSSITTTDLDAPREDLKHLKQKICRCAVEAADGARAHHLRTLGRGDRPQP